MAATGRDAGSAPADEVAAALSGAGLVRLASAPTADALAATGTIARALAATDTPYQATVVDPVPGPGRATDADVTVAVGTATPSADLTLGGPESASGRALAVATELGEIPDPSLALAGAVAAGRPDGDVAEAAQRAGIERRPGVAVPVPEVADGLAHSTLVHAPFSGDVDAARGVLAEVGVPEDAEWAALDEADRRRLASLVALSAGGDAASERAARSVERALGPYDGGPFATIGGFADVLDATAHTSPGAGVSLALGDASVREPALSAWRTHARHAHTGVRTCDTARYDGLVVASGSSMPVATVARLLADYRAPEPVVLAVGDGEAAAHAADRRATDGAGADGIGRALATAAGVADGGSIGDESRAFARFDGDADDLIAAFREAR